MFNVKKLQKNLHKDIVIHTYNFNSLKENYISFYHKKSGFYYKVNILLKDDYIFLDFHEIYSKKNFDHDRRVEMSRIAHVLKQVIKETSKHRVRLLSGVSKISWDWLIIDDVDSYLERNDKQYVENFREEIISLFEHSIKETEKEEQKKDFQYDFYLCGEDGFYLFELLDELGIAKLEERRKVDIRIEFLPVYLSKKKNFVESMLEGIRKLGFQAQLYVRKKSG